MVEPWNSGGRLSLILIGIAMIMSLAGLTLVTLHWFTETTATQELIVNNLKEPILAQDLTVQNLSTNNISSSSFESQELIVGQKLTTNSLILNNIELSNQLNLWTNAETVTATATVQPKLELKAGQSTFNLNLPSLYGKNFTVTGSPQGWFQPEPLANELIVFQKFVGQHFFFSVEIGGSWSKSNLLNTFAWRLVLLGRQNQTSLVLKEEIVDGGTNAKAWSLQAVVWVPNIITVQELGVLLQLKIDKVVSANSVTLEKMTVRLDRWS